MEISWKVPCPRDKIPQGLSIYNQEHYQCNDVLSSEFALLYM